MEILKINELHVYFSGIFVHKILNNLMYPNNYLDHAVNQNTTYSLRNSLDLRPHFSSSSQGQSSPKYYCTQIWNNIPIDIRNRPSVSSFKSSFKQHLLLRYN